MQYENSVVELKRQLSLLGFADGLETELRAKICFQPERFLLRTRLVKDADVVEFILQFDLTDSGYGCSFYEGVLRKKILIGIEAEQLDAAMHAVNWNKIDLVSFEAIDAIVGELKQLDNSEEGQQLSALLKFKHWSGTSAEDLIPNLSVLRTRYEISQRFYFLEGESQITTEEAYRFLCNRWMEKQMLLRRKQETLVALVESDSKSSSSSDNAMSRKISLLPKKKRRQGKGIK